MVRGQTAHAEVDQFAGDRRLNTSVLRNAAFRDGHVGLNFQTANNGGLKFLGRPLHFVEHAVNAVTDSKFVGQGLEMNIRRALFERFDDQGVDQLDDRRVRIDNGAVVLAEFTDFADLDFTFGDVLDHLVELAGTTPRLAAAAATVVTVQRFFDLIGSGHARFDG